MPDQAAPLLLFDVGGTDIKAAVADADGGELRGITRVSVEAGDPRGERLVERLATLAQEMLPGVPPRAVGLLVPGLVDERAKRAVFAANVGLRDAPVAELLSQRLGAPVGLGHDVGMAAEAEILEGVGAGTARSVLVVIIGTGIASSAVVSGQRVCAPGAGELGHTPVPGGLPCSCGAIGCLETVASAAGIERGYERESGTPVDGAAGVLALALAGDPVATAVWTRAVEALAFALHSAIGLFGTDRVVLGGGLSGAGEHLLRPLRHALEERLSFMPVPELVVAGLGADAGLRGARLVALRELAAAEAARLDREGRA